MKIQYDFFFSFERLGRMYENKKNKFWKPVILIPNLYLYDIKIQTDINQNGVKQIRREIAISSKIKFFETKKMKWTGPGPAQLWGLGLYWPSYKAALGPAAWAGLMFQPNKQMASYFVEHGNQLNVIR